MSTTGNEYEQPGVNQPDRGDAAGAKGTPAPHEPTRDEQPEAPPAVGEPAHHFDAIAHLRQGRLHFEETDR